MTEEIAYSCRNCRHVYRVAARGGSPPEKPACPSCGSNDVTAVSGWAPIGYNLTEGPPEWECYCQRCGQRFLVPVPASPEDAARITCPRCAGKHIHRLTPAGVEPLYCG